MAKHAVAVASCAAAWALCGGKAFPASLATHSRHAQADGGDVFLWRPADVGAQGPTFGGPEGSVGSWKQARVGWAVPPTDVLGVEYSPSHTHATHTLNLQFATLKGHNNDVQDCSWSSDGSALVTGGVDNLSCLFDLSKRRGGLQRAAETLDGHTHYVMGCAWDPKGEFVATQSADKTARLYTRAGGAAPPSGPACSQFVLANVLAKKPGTAHPQPAPTTPEQPVMPVGGHRQPLFHDENMASFFRRLAWAPDGSFLALPAGVTVAPGVAAEHGAGGAAKPAGGKAAAGAAAAPGLGNATWLFKRYCWAQPAACVPSTSGNGGKAIAVRFCPILFKNPPSPAAAAADEEAAPVTFDLPYRMVFAVATLDHVGVYDTRQATPLALVSAVHYAALTDLAWSPDGSVLAVASQDGYCTLFSFDAGELGEPCAPADIPPDVAARLQSAAVAAAKSRGEEPSAPPAAAAHQAAAMPAPGLPPPVQAAVPGASAPPAARRIVPQAVGTTAGGAAQQPRRIAPIPVGAMPTPAEPEQPVTAPADAAPAADGCAKRVEEGPVAEAPPAKVARTEDDGGGMEHEAAPDAAMPPAEAPPMA